MSDSFKTFKENIMFRNIYDAREKLSKILGRYPAITYICSSVRSFNHGS